MSFSWPDVTILLVTYDRPKEIRTTLNALQKHLVYAGKLRYHIADDNTPGSYIPDIHHDYPNLDITATVTDRKGWGANVNKALSHTQMTDYIFLIEDDYVALKEINLTKGVGIFLANKELGIIRYDGLSGHIGLRMRLTEAKTEIGRLDYMILDRKRTGHLNVYSNRPHLRHRRLHDTIGMYPEGIPLGKTEEAYAHRVIDRDNCPDVAILPDGIERAFDHIGHSRQGTDKDVGFKK